MKKVALLLLLLQTPFVLAADKPNPATFQVKVKVVTSASKTFGGERQYELQVLETIIDGQPVELTSYLSNPRVLALGDYLARPHAPHSPNTYDLYQGYDLLMPDGTARRYNVTRLGPAPTTNP